MNHHVESNHLKKVSHNCLREIDSDLIVKQLLQSFHLHLHVCCSCFSKWWTKIIEISSNNFQSSAANSYASMALKTSRSIYKNYKIRKLLNNCFTSACRASYGFDNMCSFGAACISRFTKARTILHNDDKKIQAIINMFNTHCGKSLSLDLEPNQECFSALKLPLQTATSFNFLTQASAFSDIARPHLLMRASLKQENTPTDERVSDKADVSNDSRSTCQSATDVVLAELRAESQPESPTEISAQESFIFECIQSPAEIIPGTKQSDHSLPKHHQLPLDFKDESTLQISSCQCTGYASSICNLPGHVTAASCSKTQTSSLSSILQMENISPLLVRKTINEDMLLQTCPRVSSSSSDSTASSNHTVRNRSNTLLQSFLLDLASTSAYNSGTLCNNISPPKDVSQSKSSNVHHQASPAVTTLCSPVSCWSSANNQMSSESTSTSAASTSTSAVDDSLVNSAHAQDKVRTNNKITSLLTESTDEQAVYVNKVPRVSSKMANQTSDPFLSQASFSDFNSFPSADMFDDLTSDTCSVTSPLLSSVTSQIEPGTDEEPQSHHLKDQFSSSNFQTFLDPVPESTSFVSESLSDLDSLLNTIPVNHATSIQTSFFSGWPESDASQSSDSMSISNYFFNNEACSRPSLLRKLLNKEASDIQEPANDAGWTVDQVPKKSSDVKKTKVHYGSSKTRYSDCKHVKNNKNTIRRSVELPKIRLNQRQMMQFNKYKPQFQKPTKELPLPSSIKAAGTSPSSVLLQQDPVASRVAVPESATDKESRKCSELDSSDNATNCELPDDLIDMAVECCAPLEMDQTEALISDLNDSCSWEDNLYALLESSGQENSGNDSGNESPQQTSKTPAMTCELLSNFFHSKDNFSTPLSTSPRRAESSFLHHGKLNKDKSKSSSSQTSLPSQKNITSQKINKINMYSSDVPKVSTTNCTKKPGKMSLLRAAITSDVDKLIEQIPLRNASKTTRTLYRLSEEHEDDPDIEITKVTGLKENHDLSSTHRLYHKINKVITARPLEITSKAVTCNTTEPPETSSLCKSLHSSKTAVSMSCNALSPPSVQTFKTNVSAKSCDKWKLLQNGSSCEHCGNTPKIPSIINPLVIKISIGSSSTPKVICANSGSVNNLSQHLKPDYQNRVCDKSSNPSFCRAPKSTSTDISSTQPVSVMIMRKEMNHRSRRSKSIAIQTDNEPGEVYPEFEHNSSDTILYPSTIIMYPSAVSSPQDISPISTQLSSYSSLSDIDKFLPSQPSMDDSSSSADDDYRTISSTPFLWKLLTGELSKDHYQRLDQQMIEKERKKSLLQ